MLANAHLGVRGFCTQVMDDTYYISRFIMFAMTIIFVAVVGATRIWFTWTYEHFVPHCWRVDYCAAECTPNSLSH
jgi:hypothetical protein